jgi:endoglucanase
MNTPAKLQISVRRRIRAAAILLALALGVGFAGTGTSSALGALPPLHANGTAIVDDQGRPVILHGCNLGNWLLNEMWMMEMWRDGDPKDQWQMEELLQQRFGVKEKDRLMNLFRENWIGPRDFQTIKSWGFNVVRLPFNCVLLQDEATPDQLRPDAFHWLDRAIDLATRNGIYVILDMHGAPGGQSVDQCTGHSGQNKLWEPQNRKRAAFLWGKIAERYRNNPTVAAYDLLNEPYFNYHEQNDEALVGTMDQLIHAIREVDQKHLIFCAGSLHGLSMYGPPSSHGWTNVGYTEHFYPGLFGNGQPTIETHSRFLARDIPAKEALSKQWNTPFLAGEFNVVFDKAGGAAMMRHYYDVFAGYGWAATMWSYKIVKPEGGRHPDSWYLVTNRDKLTIPMLRTASREEIEGFFKTLGSMEYAADDDLRAALTSANPPALELREFPVLAGPAPQDPLTDGWEAVDLGNPSVKGGQRVVATNSFEVFGGGRDVFEGNDECHFVWRKADDHFDLSATLTPPFDSQTYAKAGLMYRASLKADAPLVIVSLFPDGACAFAYRRHDGERITQVDMLPVGKARALRLTRNGAHFEASAVDGDGRVFATESADLPELASTNGHAGFFVLSHESTLLSKAAFTDVKFH